MIFQKMSDGTVRRKITDAKKKYISDQFFFETNGTYEFFVDDPKDPKKFWGNVKVKGDKPYKTKEYTTEDAAMKDVEKYLSKSYGFDRKFMRKF